MTTPTLDWQDLGRDDRELFVAHGESGDHEVRLWTRTDDRQHDWLVKWTPTRTDVLVREQYVHGLEEAMAAAEAWEASPPIVPWHPQP